MLMVKVRRTKTITEQGPFGPREVTTTVTEEVPLKAPKEWAMYTKAGNKKLAGYAQKAIAKIEAARADSFNKTKTIAALVWFVTRWELLSDQERYSEAGDTAVREVVGSFHDRLARASGIWDFIPESLWDSNLTKAWKRAQKIRAKRKEG